MKALAERTEFHFTELRAVATAAAAREAAAATEAAEQLTDALLTMQRRREIAREIASQRASDRIAALLADAQLAGDLKGDIATINVGVGVPVLTEARRAELMEKKQASIARQLAQEAALGTAGGGAARSA